MRNSVGLNRGGYKQNTELTTGCDTAEGNINEVATKGGTGYRGAAMFPSGRKKRDKREKGKNPAYQKSGRQLFTNGWFLQKDMAQPKEKDKCKKGMRHGRNGRLSRSCQYHQNSAMITRCSKIFF
ncbi:hypothetical protein [Bacteroides uniformis]|uniref:hypothetical protein n=1 Tax=Bacteroides uniformis TaxID=820 RepID=UPI002017A737|nr:hypothetical protein [Bacteroides uniformis]MDC1865548.1 hypothetical protein [Bacteroides uniformis]MDC1869826.1 hypothetical protein [Bacteroides uniformis]